METLRNVREYRNYIIKDPIIDYLNVYGRDLNMLRDDEFDSFNRDLLIDTYINKNKKIFISKVQSYLSGNFFSYNTKRGTIDLVMKTSDVSSFFSYNGSGNGKNKGHIRGSGYCLFTIEYTKVNMNKNNQFLVLNKQHKYYSFKNWLLKKQFIEENPDKRVDMSFVIGRSYNTCLPFNTLVENTLTYPKLLEEADEHFKNIQHYNLGLTLFPNMKNHSDFPWHNAKKLIADQLQEITLVKNISITQRDEYVKEGKTRYSQIDNDFVNNESQFVIHDKKELPDISKCFFIDFEILTSIYDTFSTFPAPNTESFLFNIGCGYIGKGNSFCFNSYVAHEIKDEYKIVKEFTDYINSLNHDYITLVHWTQVEKKVLYKKLIKYGIALNKELRWFDLHQYFIDSRIFIKGCLNYKLKFVSRHLQKYGLIESKWDKTFSDGIGAMTGYILYLQTKDKSIIESIAHYNMIDCKVLFEIFQLIMITAP